MFLELHILQNFPPSNLNRDDVGQPKEADFGGVRRARISSQCLKRAIRFAGRDKADPESQSRFEQYTQVPLASRTHLLVTALQDRLKKADRPEVEAGIVAHEFARVYSSKKGKMKRDKPNETSVLIYVTDQEIDDICQRLLESDWSNLLAEIEAAKPKPKKDKDQASMVEGNDEDEKATAKSPLKKFADEYAKEHEGRTSAPDVALFGRMLADKPTTNIDAACQVAHAISTHGVPKAEIDYYTAMDDLKPANDPGAGFLDVAYFNAACFYRYARIDVRQLTRNLGNDADGAALAIRAVEAFIRASEAAIPSGKKNSSAHECRPRFMLAVLRADQSEGWSLVNAFERPIPRSQTAGWVAPSIKALCGEFEDHLKLYGTQSVKAKTVFVAGKYAASVEGGLNTAIAKAGDEGKSALDMFVNAVMEPLRQASSAKEK